MQGRKWISLCRHTPQTPGCPCLSNMVELVEQVSVPRHPRLKKNKTVNPGCCSSDSSCSLETISQLELSCDVIGRAACVLSHILTRIHSHLCLSQDKSLATLAPLLFIKQILYMQEGARCSNAMRVTCTMHIGSGDKVI